jgi:hypothetical protein
MANEMSPTAIVFNEPIHRKQNQQLGGAIMCKLFVVVAGISVSLIASTALAQCSCGSVQTTYAPVVPTYTANYAPTVTYYTPESYVANYTPTVTYYAPEPYVANYTPTVTYYEPAPYVTNYAPAPYVANYAPATYATYYTPAAQPYVSYYGSVGWSMYGTPTVYVPGQPVRNVLRAITP